MKRKNKGVMSFAPIPWGTFPHKDTPLLVEGSTKRWSFYRPFACGDTDAALLVPFETRNDKPTVAQWMIWSKVHLAERISA